MHQYTTPTFLSDFAQSIQEAADGVPESAGRQDEERAYLIQPAPNAIEWAVGPQYANAPSLYKYTRSYQIVRDVFQLRCPICNKRGDEDTWGKTEAELRSEKLLTWSDKFKQDACAECGLTRQDFQEDGMLQPINGFHLCCGQRCLDLDTPIWTSKGMKYLRSLVRESSFDVMSEHGVRRAEPHQQTTQRECVVVKTSLGTEVTASLDHKFCVVKSDLTRHWVRAADLKPDDTLMISVGSELYGDHTISRDEAYILGCLVANGDVMSDYRTRYSHGDSEALDIFESAIGRIDVDVRYRRKGIQIELCRKSFVDWYRGRGLSAETAQHKSVPESIRCGSKEAVVAFLQGLFDGDGCAAIEKKTGRVRLTFDTTSKTLADEVQLLLLNLGIVSTLKTAPTRGFRGVGLTGTTSYKIRVKDAHVKKFHAEVGFRLSRKSQVLEEAPDATRFVEHGPVDSALWFVNRTKHLRTEVDFDYNDLVLSKKYVGKRRLSRDFLEFARVRMPLPASVRRRVDEYLDDRWVYFSVEAVEPVGVRECLDLQVDESPSFVANGVLVHNSGKSVTAAIIGCYAEHRVLTLAHSTPGGLHRYLDLDLKDLLEMTFLASNEVQGKDTIWAKYRAARADSPWFKRYTAWVSQEEKTQNTPPGMQKWVYSESSKVVRNEHPDVRLVINSLNSNSDGLRGRTRIFGGVDEIAFMKRGDSAMSADEIYRAVENSLQTVRSRTKQACGLPWLGLMCSVSSPRDKNDKAMRLLKEIENVPTMLAYHYATWEFNPYEPRENFEALYAKDPVGAERDFGAKPPMAAHPLIWDVPRFRDLVIDPTLEPACQFVYPSSEAGGHDYIGIRMVNPRPRFKNTHYVVFDAGKSFDAFAGACAHGEVDIDPETGAQRTITVFDWVCRILPPKGIEVLYEDVFGLIKTLQPHMPIRTVQFDQWNSTQLIQQIRSLGINAEQHSLKNGDWSKFRQDAYAGRVRMFAPDQADFDGHEYIAAPPQMNANTCALYELEGLEEDPITQKVTNPRKGLERGYDSNDVAQVIVHAHKLVQAVGYTAKQYDRSREGARIRAEGGAHAYARNKMGTVFNPSRFSGAGRRGGGRGW